MKYRTDAMKLIAVVTLFATVAVSTVAFAQSVKVKGVIISRTGNDMTLKAAENPNLVVVLNDATDVQQLEGVLKARKKDMAMAALIPGLACEVQGSYNGQSQLVADWVRFTGEDLEQAQSAQAAVHETAVKAAANQAELQQQADALAAQNAALKEQQAALNQQQAELRKQQQEIAANKAKIAANSARFGQLDDYYILDEVSVYFGNGQTNVDPKYVQPLMALAQQAMTYNGYNIQVKGYASAVGNAAFNQELSEDRAQNVTNILIQQAHVALTNMLAPGAMGESRQIGNDKTEKGQAENRRVVVRALLNKGIAGTMQGLPTTTTK
jgi:outer membrane protein OmpA-like peptidoglycan-associated protein